MKKLLSIIGTISIAGAGTSAVIACSNSLSSIPSPSLTGSQNIANTVKSKIEGKKIAVPASSKADASQDKAEINSALQKAAGLTDTELGYLSYPNSGKLAPGKVADIKVTITVHNKSTTATIGVTWTPADDNAGKIRQKIIINNLELLPMSSPNISEDSEVLNEALQYQNPTLTADDVKNISYSGDKLVAGAGYMKVTATIKAPDNQSQANVDLNVALPNNLKRNASLAKWDQRAQSKVFKDKKTDTYYMSGGTGGVFTSKDARNWTLTDFFTKSGDYITSIESVDDNLYLSYDDGLYVSHGNNVNWKKVSSITGSISAPPVKYDGVFYVGSKYNPGVSAPDPGYLYTSTYGVDWTKGTVSLTGGASRRPSIYAIRVLKDRVYISAGNDDLWIASKAEEGTALVNYRRAGGLFGVGVYSAPFIINGINGKSKWYLGSGEGLETSTDGIDWEPADNTGFPTTKVTYNQNAYTSPNGKVVFVATDKGLYETLDQGKTWTQAIDENVYNVQYIGGLFYACSYRGLWISVDGVHFTLYEDREKGFYPMPIFNVSHPSPEANFILIGTVYGLWEQDLFAAPGTNITPPN